MSAENALMRQDGPRGLVVAGRREKTAALVELCSVRLGETLFGIPITYILEIVGGTRPQAVPLTTVSLRQLLGMPPQEGKQDILVLESASGCFGLLVDSVGEVLTVSAAEHEPNPSVLDERRRDLFAGAYKLKECLLIMLDPERLDPVRLGAVAA